MRQLTLAMAGFERYPKTRRATSLAEMDRVVPWSTLCALIEPFYRGPGNGRPPVGVERMPRIYFLQHWFDLSDSAVEEALYDSQAMRRFVGIDLGRVPVSSSHLTTHLDAPPQAASCQVDGAVTVPQHPRYGSASCAAREDTD